MVAFFIFAHIPAHGEVRRDVGKEAIMAFYNYFSLAMVSPSSPKVLP